MKITPIAQQAARLTRPACLAAGLAAAVSPRPALAQSGPDRPLLQPTRDVTVTYQVDAPQVPVREVRVEIAAGLRRARIDAGDATSLLLDPVAGQGVVMLNGLHVYSRLPGRGRDLEDYLLDPAMRFSRAGSAIVAGLACTEWRVTAPRGTGTGCVTADGVLLRFAGTDNRDRQGSLVASAVQYGPLAPSLFVPPADFHALSFPGAFAGSSP